LAISSFASRDCFASYFGSLCLWRGLDLAETLLGGAFAQSFLNNLNAVLFWLFGSLAFMPMAQALAGLFTSPIFVLLITALALGEKIGPIRVIAVSLGFLGILLVLNKGLIDLNIISFLPVLGGVFYALAAVATR
jgi:drug/metabolite transporter (DMT)-like permease